HSGRTCHVYAAESACAAGARAAVWEIRTEKHSQLNPAFTLLANLLKRSAVDFQMRLRRYAILPQLRFLQGDRRGTRRESVALPTNAKAATPVPLAREWRRFFLPYAPRDYLRRRGVRCDWLVYANREIYCS